MNSLLQRSFFVLILIFAVVSLLLSGCSRNEAKYEREVPGGKLKVDTEKGKLEVETREGKSEIEAGSGVELPEGFPQSFPIYEKSELVQKLKVNNEAGEGYMLVFKSGDSVKEVADWFQLNLKERGYKITFTMEQEEGSTIAFREPSGKHEGSVQISKTETGSEILVTLVFVQ